MTARIGNIHFQFSGRTAEPGVTGRYAGCDATLIGAERVDTVRAVACKGGGVFGADGTRAAQNREMISCSLAATTPSLSAKEARTCCRYDASGIPEKRRSWPASASLSESTPLLWISLHVEVARPRSCSGVWGKPRRFIASESKPNSWLLTLPSAEIKQHAALKKSRASSCVAPCCCMIAHPRFVGVRCPARRGEYDLVMRASTKEWKGIGGRTGSPGTVRDKAMTPT